MPNVPKLNPIEASPIQVPQFSGSDINKQLGALAASGENVFKAASNVASISDQIVDKERQHADEVVITDAQRKLIEAKNDLFYNPEKGALTKKGKDAFGIVSQYGELFDQRAEEIEKELSSEAQKQAFRKVRGQQSMEFNQNLQHHLFAEAKEFEKNTLNSGISVNRDDAILNYAMPGKVQQSIAQQDELLLKFAQRNGIPPDSDQFKELRANNASKTHASVITRMMSNDQDLLAKEYFAENKSMLVGPDLLQAERAVEEGSLRGESQRQSDAIMSKALSYSEAMNEVKKVEDPKLRDAITDRVKNNFATMEVAKRQEQETRMQDLTNFILQTKGQSEIPLNRKLNLTPAEITSLDNFRKHVVNGTEPVTDWNEYYNLKTLASSPISQNDYLKLNLMLYRDKFSDPQFKELIDLQTSMRNKDGKADPILNGFRTDSEIVNSTLSEIGIDPTPKQGSDDAKQVNLFRQRVDEKIVQHQQVTGKKATTQEIQEIVDNMASQVIKKKGFFWDTKQRAFELNSGEDFEDVAIDAIPRSEKVKIEEALRRKNLPISDKSVKELYIRKLRSQLGN